MDQNEWNDLSSKQKILAPSASSSLNRQFWNLSLFKLLTKATFIASYPKNSSASRSNVWQCFSFNFCTHKKPQNNKAQALKCSLPIKQPSSLKTHSSRRNPRSFTSPTPSYSLDPPRPKKPRIRRTAEAITVNTSCGAAYSRAQIRHNSQRNYRSPCYGLGSRAGGTVFSAIDKTIKARSVTALGQHQRRPGRLGGTDEWFGARPGVPARPYARARDQRRRPCTCDCGGILWNFRLFFEAARDICVWKFGNYKFFGVFIHDFCWIIIWIRTGQENHLWIGKTRSRFSGSRFRSLSTIN